MKVCLEQSRASMSRAPGDSSLFLLALAISIYSSYGLYLSRAQQPPLSRSFLLRLPHPIRIELRSLSLTKLYTRRPTGGGTSLAAAGDWPGRRRVEAAPGHGQIQAGIRRLRPRPGKGGPVAATNRQSQAADGRGQVAPGRSRRGRSGRRGRGSEPRRGTCHGVQPAAPTMPTESPVSF